VDPGPVADRLGAVRHRIETAGDPEQVRIVAVTKGFGEDAVRAAVELGLCDIGENYAQELLVKSAQLGDLAPLRWHFLGHIQRNKVRALAPVVACFQGLSRTAEAHEIARRAPGARVLVEVDTTGEPGRGGVGVSEVPALVAELADISVHVEGLMTVAPRDPEAARACFRTVRELADRLGLAERSMGMSDDVELAVSEGSTMVRIGRGLFGPRAPASVNTA